ncbi:hypothetical protein [Serratia fonticola]
MNTHNVKTAALESSERWGEEQNPFVINLAEGVRGADYADYDVYEFKSLKELQKFRKAYPEKMKHEYNYALTKTVNPVGDSFIGKSIVIVSEAHFKKFIKQVKASGVSI